MRRCCTLLGLLVLAVMARSQQVVDRIAVRLQEDVITDSEVRELDAFQRLVQGHDAPRDELVSQLVEQWIVEKEAAMANFPEPDSAQVSAAWDHLQRQFASKEDFLARMRELDLTEPAVRRILKRQLHEARYLDFKFRPAIQIDDRQVAKHYQTELAVELKARGQAVPPLEDVADQIRELLTQREISQRTARWLQETKSRLTIEVMPGGPLP